MAGQFAIVTGASSGIGLSLAKELATRGYDLAICSSGQRLQAAAEELRGQGVQVTEIQADLATPEGVDQFWEQVQSLGRSIDVACLNAGVGVGGLFAETDLDAELNMVDLNCAGTVQLAKYVVQHMLSRNEGKILFTASIAGEMVAPREAVYAATKAFVLSFAHSLRYELRDTGISVTALQPGPTNTDFFQRAGMDNTEGRIRAERLKASPRMSRARASKHCCPAKTTSTLRRRRQRSKACWQISLPAV